MKISGEAGFLMYPNPVLDRGVLEFTLETAGKCFINLIDISGKQVMTLEDNYFEAGNHVIFVNLADVPGGIYLCNMKINGKSAVSTKHIQYR